MQLRRAVAAAGFILALAAGPARAADLFAAAVGEGVGDKEAAACLDAHETSRCLITLLAGRSSAVQGSLDLVRPDAAGDGGIDYVAALRQTLRRDRAGEPPEAALAPVMALAETPRTGGLAVLCVSGAQWIPADSSAAYAAWRQRLRGSPALLKAAAAHYAAIAGKARAESADQRRARLVSLAGCWAAVGDLDAARRVRAAAGYSDPSAEVTSLTVALAFDAAAAAAERARPREVDARTPLMRFVGLQQARLWLVAVAHGAGRDDVATRAAEAAITAAVAPDRPVNAVMDSGVAGAMLYFIARNDRARLAAWAERVDPLVGQGRRGWNYDDAVALYRAWRALGRADRAKALHDRVAAYDAHGQVRTGPDYVLGAMLAADGDVAGALKLATAGDLFTLGLKAGEGARDLEALVAGAGSDAERARVLTTCAMPSTLADIGRPVPPDLPLDVAAGCARRLAALPYPASAPKDTAMAALTVAGRAGRAGRAPLLREMLAATLTAWREPRIPARPLDSTEMLMLSDAALSDLWLADAL